MGASSFWGSGTHAPQLDINHHCHTNSCRTATHSDQQFSKPCTRQATVFLWCVNARDAAANHYASSLVPTLQTVSLTVALRALRT